ncbi:hypothetical protein ACNF49_14095 [Actinomadura sp. ATCC 39365]
MSDTDNVQPTPEKAAEQQNDNDWPRPGEEGYVTPDGTPQSIKQLEDNRRAAADRAAAGSTVHGAPLATPGPTPDAERAKAVERAENYSGKTVEDRDEAVTEWIDDKTEEKTDEASDDTPDTSDAKPKVTRRKTDTSK